MANYVKAFGSILIVSLLLPWHLCGQDLYVSPFEWQAPGGKYIDPVSFFSVHGYVNAVYAGESPDWTEGNFNGIGMPGQVIVPNTNNSSFANDEAIWLSSEVNENLTFMMELHLVNDPSGNGAAGPGGLTFVLTEANAKVRIIKNYLNISAGTFWSVFGIHNQDWLGAQNTFSLIPIASAAYISHHNEKGVRLDGFHEDGDFGINYVLSLGNGYNAYDISGYDGWDANNNKMINGRVSVYPGLGKKLNIGASYANGILRDKVDESVSLTNIRAYNNSLEAIGVDLTLDLKFLNLRSYYIRSTQKLTNQNEGIDVSVRNQGLLIESYLRLKTDQISWLDSLEPKVRFDLLDRANDPTGGNGNYSTFASGINFNILSNMIVSFDYNILQEENDLNNNRFIARTSLNF